MGRPKKSQHDNEALVGDSTIDGIGFDDIKEAETELTTEELSVVELPVVGEVVEFPALKDMFVFTDCDTGKHHVFDTEEEANTFKEGKNGLIRTGVYNVPNKNLDVIYG